MASKKNRKTLVVGKVTLSPLAGSKDLEVEMGGKSERVPYKDLWGAMFVLGDGKYREAMLPERKEERMVFSRKLQVRASKDIAKGEEITLWVEFDVARLIVERIAEKNGAKVIEPSAAPALSTPGEIAEPPAGVQ